MGKVLDGGWERRPDELTDFKSTGFAGLDVAAASVAYAAARAGDIGTWVEL